MAELRTGDGRALPPLLRTELDRLRRRLVLTLELIRELEAERATALEAAADDAMTHKIIALHASEASARTLPPCWRARCFIAPSPIAASSPATSASCQCLIGAAAWAAARASAEPATLVRAQP